VKHVNNASFSGFTPNSYIYGKYVFLFYRLSLKYKYFRLSTKSLICFIFVINCSLELSFIGLFESNYWVYYVTYDITV
jgi:hypothetical protein